MKVIQSTSNQVLLLKLEKNTCEYSMIYERQLVLHLLVYERSGFQITYLNCFFDFHLNHLFTVCLDCFYGGLLYTHRAIVQTRS